TIQGAVGHLNQSAGPHQFALKNGALKFIPRGKDAVAVIVNQKTWFLAVRILRNSDLNGLSAELRHANTHRSRYCGKITIGSAHEIHRLVSVKYSFRREGPKHYSAVNIATTNYVLAGGILLTFPVEPDKVRIS